MNIHFHGAARTTTGSMYLLEVNGQRLLLECGLYQGRRDESNERNRHFPFDPKTLDAAILSHAHIDHCGNFPNLCKQGFTGNIYSTFATRDLAEWRPVLEKAGVTFGAVFSVDEAADDRQARQIGALVPFADGAGLTISSPFDLDGVPKVAPRRAPGGPCARA